MRNLTILVLLALTVPPILATKPATTQMVTVEQLEQFLSASHGEKDGKLANQIADMKLTERLSDAKLTGLEEELSGSKSREALLALADESAFLDLPAVDIPSSRAPDPAAQAALLAKAVDYVNKTVAKLPDFYATKTSISFAGTPTVISHDLHRAIPSLAHAGYQRLAAIGTSSITVLYRNGLDAYDHNKKRLENDCGYSGMSSGTGEFGQVLALVPVIVAQGSVVWSHWEQGNAEPQAVFRYSAMLPFQDYLRCPGEMNIPPGPYEYHGEIAINPVDGSIPRVTNALRLLIDWDDSGPQMNGGDIMVKYGPVEIGGTTYICPVRSVFLGLQPAFTASPSWRENFDHGFGLAEDPIFEGLDDVSFGQYHLFRAEVRIRPGINAAPESAPPTSTPPTAQPKITPVPPQN
jgi:hypothetical protein